MYAPEYRDVTLAIDDGNSLFMFGLVMFTNVATIPISLTTLVTLT